MKVHDNSFNKGNTFQALWLLMGSFSTLALAIVSAAILSRYLDKHQYGTYRQILYVYTTLSIIFSAGLPKVFSYFLPRFSLSQGKDIVWKITKILFIFGLLFSGFLFFFSGLISKLLNNAELEIGLKTFAIIPAFLLPTLGVEGIFSTYKKTIYVAIYNTLTKILTLLFIVLPVIIFEGTYIIAIYGWVIVSFISLIIALLLKNMPFKNVRSVKAGLSFQEIFNYSIPLVIASFWGILISASDQFYISRFYGAEVFAEFSNGFTEVPFVGMVTASASVVLMPVFSKMVFDKTHTDDIIRLWTSVLMKSALVIYPLVVFFIFFSKQIIVILYSEKYAVSSIYFQINIFYNFFNIIVFAPLLLAMGKTKLYANVHMFLAFSIWILGLVIVHTFDSPIAIAILSVTMRIIKIIIFTFLISKILKISTLKLFPMKILSKIIMHNLFVGAIVWTVNVFLFNFNISLLTLIVSFIIYITLILISSRLVGIDYIFVLKPLLERIKSYF